MLFAGRPSLHFTGAASCGLCQAQRRGQGGAGAGFAADSAMCNWRSPGGASHLPCLEGGIGVCSVYRLEVLVAERRIDLKKDTRQTWFHGEEW